MTTTVARLGVVGAGQMGRGIAQVAAAAGIDVMLVDTTAAGAAAGKATILGQLEKLVAKGKLGAERRDATAAHLHAGAGLSALGAADFAVDFVIEAASETLELKQTIFAQLDDLSGPDVVLATNTSSISIGQLAAATRRPDRIVGMHFMNPVPVMTLVEIIRGVATSEATYTTTRDLALHLGKETVVSQDKAGFIVNRVLMPMLNEACFALYEGVASAVDIDKAIVLGLNHPLGPLALADLIGLDTTLAILEVMHKDLASDKYRPCPLLRQYVAAGRLGRKSGRGFHEYI